MKQTLGRVMMETVVEVPTKHVKGVQRYKHMKQWISIPHEVVELSLLHKLRRRAEQGQGMYVEVHVQSETTRTPHYLDQYIGTPVRTYVLRGEINYTKE